MINFLEAHREFRAVPEVQASPLQHQYGFLDTVFLTERLSALGYNLTCNLPEHSNGCKLKYSNITLWDGGAKNTVLQGETLGKVWLEFNIQKSEVYQGLGMREEAEGVGKLSPHKRGSTHKVQAK